MIIDIHTHTFPDNVAEKALKGLSNDGLLHPFTDGTYDGLLRSVKSSGVDGAVVLPIATKPSQTENINAIAYDVNQHFEETGIMSFGTLHPQNEDKDRIIKDLKEKGFKGIKVHPIFQGCFFDDPEMKRIIACANDMDLIIMTHSGRDISYPGMENSATEHIIPVLKEVKPKKMILAHMGSWGQWGKGFSVFTEYDVYIDTAFAVKPAYLKEKPRDPECDFMEKEAFCRWIKKTGPERILFGTDSPWSSQKESIELIKDMPLSFLEKKKILGDNAKALLGL